VNCLIALTAESSRKSQASRHSQPRALTAESLGREKWLQSQWVSSGPWLLIVPFQHSSYPWTRPPSLILGQHQLKEPSGQILTAWLLVFPADCRPVWDTSHH